VVEKEGFDARRTRPEELFHWLNIPYDCDGDRFFVGDLDLRDKNLSRLPNLRNVVVRGDFDCSYNRLSTLEGSPQEVGGNYDCSRNDLTSLRGAPRKVGGSFNCSDNALTSLRGLPESIGEVGIYANYRPTSRIIADTNPLASLEGLPVAFDELVCDSGDGRTHFTPDKIAEWIGAEKDRIHAGGKRVRAPSRPSR